MPTTKTKKSQGRKASGGTNELKDLIKAASSAMPKPPPCEREHDFDVLWNATNEIRESERKNTNFGHFAEVSSTCTPLDSHEVAVLIDQIEDLTDWNGGEIDFPDCGQLGTFIANYGSLLERYKALCALMPLAQRIADRIDDLKKGVRDDSAKDAAKKDHAGRP